MPTRRRVLQAATGVSLVVAAWMLRIDTPADHSLESARAAESRTVSPGERADAIARGQMWRAPKTPIDQASLAPEVAPELECRFTVTDIDGTTPTFRCLLDDREEVRAKYGPVGEIPGDVATTRLLSVLGFGADRVTLVKRLRCYGCPKDTGSLYRKTIDRSKYEEFEWVTVEHRLTAPAIETSEWKGWAFFELDMVDPSRGGAPREHVDALRLLAVFLAHWDNKPDNQRLVCLAESWPEGAPCRAPFLMLQNVGSTFGPRTVDLASWATTELWQDRETCTVSMRYMPLGGGTFQSGRISDRGRRFLAGLLGQLTDAQLTDLFAGAGFDRPRLPLMQKTTVPEWVRVFKQRVKAISEGPSCPDA